MSCDIEILTCFSLSGHEEAVVKNDQLQLFLLTGMGLDNISSKRLLEGLMKKLAVIFGMY